MHYIHNNIRMQSIVLRIGLRGNAAGIYYYYHRTEKRKTNENLMNRLFCIEERVITRKKNQCSRDYDIFYILCINFVYNLIG